MKKLLCSNCPFTYYVTLLYQLYRCYNAPVNGQIQSLSFDVVIPADGTYQFGVVYSNPVAGKNAMTLTVDGSTTLSTSFGALLTPSTPTWNNWKLGLTAKNGTLTAGQHTFTIAVVAQGSTFHVDSIVVGDTTAPLTMPLRYVLPADTQTVYADSLISYTTNMPFNASLFASPAPLNATWNSSLVNFCVSPVDPTHYDWCYNTPQNFQHSSITLPINVTVQTNHYFAIEYSATNTSSLVVYIDGLPRGLGDISTPMTGNTLAYGIAPLSMGVALTVGMHSITIESTKGNVKVSKVYMSATPIQPYAPFFNNPLITTIAPPSTTTAVVTPAGSVNIVTTTPVSQQVNSSGGGAVLILDSNAIIGIAVGATVFLALVITIVVIVVRRNNSKAKNGEVSQVKTPAKYMTPRTVAANKA